MLRPFDMRDVNDVAELWRRTRAAVYGADPTACEADDWEHRRIRDARARGCEIMVYEVGSAIAAFMIFDPAVAHVQQLFVDIPFQRKGIGKEMLDWLKAQFPDGWSLNVMANNRTAIVFYERYGLV